MLWQLFSTLALCCLVAVAIDVRKSLGLVSQILGIVAPRTPTAIDDTLHSLVLAILASPALLDIVQGWLGVPEGAQAMIDPEDPHLIAAIEGSPEMLLWGRRRLPRDTTPIPVGTEPLSIVSAIAIAKLLIQYWPMIKDLLSVFKGQQPQT